LLSSQALSVKLTNSIPRPVAMSTDTPYQAAKHAVTSKANAPTTMLWSALVVFLCTVAGGMLGLAAGAALGTLVPGYYRAVFSSGGAPHFDPLAVGIGQGVTQGVGFGAVIGLALVAMYYWYNSRLNRVLQRNHETAS
jgi:hypothetical protein